jgi:3-dehydroshikimate dehydratase
VNAVRPGLCTVTLRTLPVDAVAELASECGLRAIEWGGDVHVPPGDAVAAVRARDASDAAGVEIASYGSYAFADLGSDRPDPIAVLDTAATLGAPNVRVWAGFGVEAATPGYATLVERLRSFATAAAARAITVSLEFHGGTATATVAGTHALLDAVGATNLRTYWQPPYWRGPTTPEADAAEVEALGERLSHLHVYEWAGPEIRRPLASGSARWRAVLAAVSGAPRVAFLEFVEGDDPDALRRDAATLRSWLAAP